METKERDNGTPYPDVPAVMESKHDEYVDPGIVSTVNVAGHPLHPVIVTMPIGLLVTAAGSDIGYFFTQDNFWARASIWLIGLGLVTAIAAAITGMSDFLRIKRVRKNTAGWAHMYINIAILGLTLVNYLLRLGNPADAILPTGIIISILTATLLGISGWYGGELVYRHKVSVIGPSSRKQ
ncbi:DUF2231 domain-containing protein [Microcoleus sp. FACHB-1515]|uniref:DUF2231 domain-containing protein n=1 Tax=Cyanophyceae TaxID=3028117 RepID=UPI001683D1B8|nr:DUF2231 domain-containing protein [Microcoleus sp. FACHB-1515]MBD2091206.1 DUF2231 domain-containing protein [Microcoleus sp. FACHB-1515]